MNPITAPAGLAASASALGAGAVGEAAGEAVAGLHGDPGLLLAFTSGAFSPQEAAAALDDAAPGAVSAGISGRGVFSADGPIEHGCVVIAFESSMRAGLGIGCPANTDLRTAGQEAARAALAELGDDPVHPLVLLLLDTRVGDAAEAIAGAYEACGPAIPLAGGACGGESPFQMADGDGLTGSVVAVALTNPEPFGIGNAQTCKVVGTPSIVTRSEGQYIWEIDGRPAEHVYLEQLGVPGQELSDEEFAAMAITHPLSQPELHGNRRLRHVLGRVGEGGIECATHIPSTAAIEFTVLDRGELIRSGWESVSTALGPLEARPPRAALVFDCAGRRKILGAAQDDEVKAIAESFGSDPPPLAGLYTNGEVARVRGAKGDHNHAVVTVAFA